MKNICIAAFMALAVASCKEEVKTKTTTDTTVTDTIALAPEKKDTPTDTATVNEAWRKYMAPNEAHKMMAAENGTWNNEMTFWMGPDAQPEKHKSVSRAKMILGGRYQEVTYSGDMMGQPFEGRSTLGFNNTNNQYTSTWIDNMGTGTMVATGVYDEAAKVINFKGEMVNPVDGSKTPFREVYAIIDANTRKMETFDTKNGKEYKSMEIVMKREK